MYRTKSEWLMLCSPRDIEAIEEMLHENGPYSATEVLEAILIYHGYGMGVDRFRDLCESYIAE